MNEEILNGYKVFLAVNHRKELTRNTYFYPVKLFIHQLDKPTDQLTQKDINHWLMHQNINGYRQNGIVTRIVALNKFLTWIERVDLKIKKPPWAKTYRRTIDFNDIQRMIRAAEKLGTKHELIIRCITDLDCRGNEIYNLKWSNIINDKIYFDDTKTGDNYGFLTPTLQDILERWRHERPTPNKGYEDYILISDKSNSKGKSYCVTGNAVQRVIKEIAYHAEIGVKVNPYDLRASVITEEFNHYVNPKTIQRKARHRNQLTTQRYNHVDDEMVREYVTFNLIFDKPSLQDKERKQHPINLNLSPSISPQGLYKPLETEDNSTFSFSFSFFPTPLFIGELPTMGLGFCLPHEIDTPFFNSAFSQSLLSSQGVIT